MPGKIRRTSSRTASATNLASKMALATITSHNHPQQGDKDGEKHLRKRTASSQGLAHQQPKLFSRTGSESKLNNKSNAKHLEQHVSNAADSQTNDDEDWVSSSSAVASPAPEPDDEEEDAVIYVNAHINSRHAYHESPPATPKRTNHHLPHQRHHPTQMTSHATEQTSVPSRYPNHPPVHRSQNVAPTEPSRIHFAGEPTGPAFQAHPQDSRIHHNGAVHHVSPPPASAAAVNPADQVQLSSSVIKMSDAPEKYVNGNHHHHPSQRTDHPQRGDEKGNRRSSARMQQEQVDDYASRQSATTQSVRPAVPGNGQVNGHVAEGDIGRTSQRGFGAPHTPVQHHFNDAPPQLAPLAHNSPPLQRHRPSLLRRDTTPTAASRSPIAVDTPPRSQTPPASMTHDEIVANNNKRHSVHSLGGHRRPMSLLQPSQPSKRRSLSSRTGVHYGCGHGHGPNNPLSLLVRLNPAQVSPLTAPPTLSPGVAHGEIDNDSNYISMSPTVSYSGRSLRRKASGASLNSVATAPVVSTSSTMAMGSSASPTSALKTSSAILSSLAHQPTKQPSVSTHSDSKPDLRRTDSLRTEDGPNFVSQFCGPAVHESGRTGGRRAKPLGRVMAGGEWTPHQTAVNHRGLLFESFSRLSAARPASTRVKR